MIGKQLLEYTTIAENKLETVFSAGSEGYLTYWTNTNENEITPLNFSSTSTEIDYMCEQEMLKLVNAERQKNGLQPLKEDLLIRNVARAHSRDMLLRGYFSHDSTDGKNLYDRLIEANVNFKQTAENIALGPTVELAFIGLMNSPKHRDNILDKDFNKVGIGIIDAGAYGLMVTQDFTDSL